MRTSHNRNPGYRIIFLFIKFIFFCEIIKQIYLVTAAEDKELSGGPNALAIPDFFVDTLDGIIFNPIIESATRKRVALIDANLRAKISSSEVDNTLSLCDEIIYEVLRENAWIARDQLIYDIHTKSLQIVLSSPESSYDLSSIGSYSIKHQQIVLSYKPGSVKDNYKMALLNELMSHLVVMSNKRCGIDTKEYELMAVPFLKKDGTVDPTLKKKFEGSINLGLKRLEQVKVLWEKRKEKLSISENNLLIQFLVAVKYYTPKTYYVSLDSFGGSSKFNKMVAEFFRKDGDYLEPGPNMHGTPFFRGKIAGNYFISHHTHNTRSATGRLRGFLIDFEQARISMDSKEGPYAKLASHFKISEFASFITELPKPILELFFSEFLSNMKWYLARCRPNVTTDVQNTKAARDTFFKPSTDNAKQPVDKRISPTVSQGPRRNN
jgi:hypothetical protein